MAVIARSDLNLSNKKLQALGALFSQYPPMLRLLVVLPCWQCQGPVSSLLVDTGVTSTSRSIDQWDGVMGHGREPESDVMGHVADFRPEETPGGNPGGSDRIHHLSCCLWLSLSQLDWNCDVHMNQHQLHVLMQTMNLPFVSPRQLFNFWIKCETGDF